MNQEAYLNTKIHANLLIFLREFSINEFEYLVAYLRKLLDEYKQSPLSLYGYLGHYESNCRFVASMPSKKSSLTEFTCDLKLNANIFNEDESQYTFETLNAKCDAGKNATCLILILSDRYCVSNFFCCPKFIKY